VTGFTRWGFWNGISAGGFLDKTWKPLPNGEQFKRLVYHDWWTDLSAKTDAQGQLAVRGFYGDYDIKVEHDGQTYSVPAKLVRSGDNSVIVTLSDAARQAELLQRKTARQEKKAALETLDARIVARHETEAKARAEAGRLDADKVASSGKARIGVGGKSLDAVLKPLDGANGELSNPSWMPPDQAAHVLVFQQAVKADQWQPLQLQFGSDKDATIPLSLVSEFTKEDEAPVWVVYDDVTIEGAAHAPPGDFEQIERNAPAGWSIKKRKMPARMIEGMAHGGERAVAASFGGPIETTLEVKANQPVTVRVWARLYAAEGNSTP
jgi:hypothetical protein